ncbi:uncharacterized protein (TIGR02171 family) [Hallerella porci]|uniref:Uncharacterized protein (TIGR02171 family) n=2 Tax=Fibrobacteraceae TaxID=204431 RepID=A0ABX5LMU0_9BACT|nr:uncharacterized protein (TIGR02171 family) [Hallerella porci]
MHSALRGTTLGTSLESAPTSEKPEMTVNFDYDFSLGAHEVTRKEYATWTGKNIERQNDLPMTNVTYFDAILAANSRSKFEGLDSVYTYRKLQMSEGSCLGIENLAFHPEANGYRLPTEAEWTFAAKNVHFNPEKSWNVSNAGDSLHPVCTSEPKAILCDMAGNAMEWVNDWFVPFSDTTLLNFIGGAQSDAIGKRILKGGYFRKAADNMRIYSRGDVYTVTSSTKADYVGFRLARGMIPSPSTLNSSNSNFSPENFSVLPALELKKKLRTSQVRLAFRDDESGNIFAVDYTNGSSALFALPKKGNVYHPAISPNGKWIAMTSKPEGISGFDTLSVQPFNAADSTHFLYNESSAAEPRWRISHGDTLIYFGTDGGDNSSDGKFFGEKTLAVSFQNQKFGAEREIFAGSYHGGISDDENLAVSGSKLLRARVRGKDTVWYHGEQACNVSLSPDSTKRVLFLDFGSKTGREFVGKNYAPHEFILIADSSGKLIQAILAPDGYTFDHTEWTNAPDFIAATLVNEEGVHSKIVLVDTKDSSVTTLVEGNELWHPNVWIQPSAIRLPQKYAADSLGVYMTGNSSISSRIQKVKMDLFWKYRGQAEIAITGSSRCFAGIDPTLLSTSENRLAINYAFSGEDMAGTEYLSVNYYLPLEKLKFLILALDIDRWAITDEGFRTLYVEVPGYLYDEHHDFWKKGVPDEMENFVAANPSPPSDEYSLYAYHLGWHYSTLSGYETPVDLAFSPYEMKKAHYNQEKLLSILDVAKSYGVQVVGIIFPQAPEYIASGKSWGRYGPSLADAKMLLQTLDSLAKQKSNFTLFDEYKNGENDYASEDFADYDHLNQSGALKLTQRLDSLLQKLRQEKF